MGDTVEYQKVDFSTINVVPGDVIVLRLEADPSMAVIERIKEDMERHFPNNKCLVLSGAELGIIRGANNGN